MYSHKTRTPYIYHLARSAHSRATLPYQLLPLFYQITRRTRCRLSSASTNPIDNSINYKAHDMPAIFVPMYTITRRRTLCRWRSMLHHHKRAICICLTLCFIFFCTFQLVLTTPFLPNHLLLLHSCARVSPHHLKHFSAAPLSTFSTFFDSFLFEPSDDKPLDLQNVNRSYSSDIQSMLSVSEIALRQLTADHSIIVHNFTIGYSHLARRWGLRYVLHVQSSSSSSPYLRHDVFVFQNTFDGSCILSSTQIPARVTNQTVYMIVPYSERYARLRWFLKQFDSLRAKNVPAELILALCGKNETDTSIARRLVQELNNSNHVRIVSHIGSKFSRSVCIREATKIVSTSSLLFISDVDMYIYPAMFESCRLNSIQGSQVYFPVFYSLFPGNGRIAEGNGFWRYTSFGMSCMYKSDFDAVGAYRDAESRFSGWGEEDVFLKDAFVHHPAYEVFRAVEPALRHRWHPKVCDPFSRFYNGCLAMKYRQLGVPRHVGKVLSERDEDIERLFAQRFERDFNGVS